MAPAKFHRCKACGFTSEITDAGVARMQEHLKTHAGDRSVKQRDVYVELRSR